MPNLFDYAASNPQDSVPTPELKPQDFQPDEQFSPSDIVPTFGDIVMRPYQSDAERRVYEEWTGYTDAGGVVHDPVMSTLIVCPTGCGKTVIFASIIRNRPPGKAMVIAHREELIFQNKHTIEAVTGAVADVEMAGYWAGGSDVVIATVQTLSRGRIEAFKPEDFSLLIIDECFPAGTRVDGRPIESVRFGDTVRTHRGLGFVTCLMRRQVSCLCRIRLATGQSLVTTPNHPIWTTEGFAPAFSLTSRSMVVSITPTTGERHADRSGWELPSCTLPEGSGPEEGRDARFVRVDSVEILEQGRGGEFERLCPDGAVYNLEVSNGNTYHADGILVHNCHHATASTYDKVSNWFKGNPNLRILGVTATPDRADEIALGKVFQTVAYDYELPDAIRDGWLVPVLAQPVAVAGLDYSSIRTTAGDLNGADLEAVMLAEQPLQKMVQATIEISMGLAPHTLSPLVDLPPDEFAVKMAEVVQSNRIKKCLVFCVTVAHAERLAEILNRWIPDVAQWVCGKTNKDIRRERFADYKAGKFKILVNVGVATEGFDEPTVEVIVLGRPTKSRCLYSQMVGRGTRALPGVVDGPQTPELRKAAIAASAKPNVLVVDFTGNTGRHQLVCTADILGGNYSDEVIEKAKKATENAGAPKDVSEALDEAQRAVDEEKAREAARREKLRAKTKYIVEAPIDAFAMFKVTKYRERGWERSKSITEKMRACLEKQKIWKEDLTFSEARQLIQGMADRRTKNLCSLNQLRVIQKHGFGPDTTFADASKIIDTLVNNKWRLPSGFSLTSKA
jgi:superfamily II DNA or RNA helicase